jgi:hypothetical protein
MNESVGAYVPNDFMMPSGIYRQPFNNVPTPPDFVGTHKRPDNIFVSASKMPREKGTFTPNDFLSQVEPPSETNPLFKQYDSRGTLPSFLKKRGNSLGQQDTDSNKNSVATTTADNFGIFNGVENRLPPKNAVKETTNFKNATQNIPKNYSLPVT